MHNWAIVNRDRTIERFGYDPMNLKPTSEKRVIGNCEECSREKESSLANILRSRLCLSCAQKNRMIERNSREIGQTYGKLTILSLTGVTRGETVAQAQCHCGEIVSKSLKRVKARNTYLMCDVCYLKESGTNVLPGSLTKLNEQLHKEQKKLCSLCKEVKPITEYRAVRGRKHGVYEKCLVCEPWYKKFRQVMSYEQYLGAIAETNCEICGKTPGKLDIDHDHKKMRFRGVLCGQCNKGIGLFYDNPDILRSAAQYLEQKLIGEN